MTLDELERHADIVANRWDEYNDSAADAAVRLARAVLAMLPLAKAALKIDHIVIGGHEWGCGNSRPCDSCDLVSAIDTFRRALAEGE